jgi:DNA-binding protein Fis
MLTEIVFLKQSLIEKIEHALKNYIIDTNTNEENDIFMEFYFKDHVEILFNKLITHYYENVFG